MNRNFTEREAEEKAKLEVRRISHTQFLTIQVVSETEPIDNIVHDIAKGIGYKAPTDFQKELSQL